MKKRIVYSLKLATMLVAEGFKVIDCVLNHKDSSKIVHVFEYPEELESDFNAIMEQYKRR